MRSRRAWAWSAYSCRVFRREKMSCLKCRWVAVVVLVLCALPCFAGRYDDSPMPEDVLSARTLAIVVRVMGTAGSDVEQYKSRIESAAIAEIQKKNRFQLVSDPAKADLVCVLIDYSFEDWREAFRHGESFREKWRGHIWAMLPPEAIIVMKGGSNPQ